MFKTRAISETMNRCDLGAAYITAGSCLPNDLRASVLCAEALQFGFPIETTEAGFKAAIAVEATGKAKDIPPASLVRATPAQEATGEMASGCSWIATISIIRNTVSST